MANDFLCPFCRGHLTVNEVVVLSIKSGQQEKGLILLSPEIGNYTNHTHSSFKIPQYKTTSQAMQAYYDRGRL